MNVSKSNPLQCPREVTFNDNINPLQNHELVLINSGFKTFEHITIKDNVNSETLIWFYLRPFDPNIPPAPYPTCSVSNFQSDFVPSVEAVVKSTQYIKYQTTFSFKHIYCLFSWKSGNWVIACVCMCTFTCLPVSIKLSHEPLSGFT